MPHESIIEYAIDAIYGHVGFADMLNALPAAIYTTDANGIITYFNDACTVFSGRSPVIGTHWRSRWKIMDDKCNLFDGETAMDICLRTKKPVRDMVSCAMREDGSLVHYLPHPTPLFDKEGNMVAVVNMIVDITKEVESKEHERLLSSEVVHRANNLLAVIQGMVAMTDADTLADYKEKINGRIQAIAVANSLIVDGAWKEVQLETILHRELAPYVGRYTLVGDPTSYRDKAAQAAAMCIHELATNSVKYGSLSLPDGHVTFSWGMREDGFFALEWRETGGPEILGEPKRSGLGTRVLMSGAKAFGGHTTMEWNRGGLVCTFFARPDRL